MATILASVRVRVLMQHSHLNQELWDSAVAQGGLRLILSSC